MDAIETLRQDVLHGRIGAEWLLDLIGTLQRQLQAAQQQIQVTQQQLQAAQQRIEELEKKCGGSPTAKIDEPFSVRAEEKRQEARSKKKGKRKKKGRRGRLTTQEKIARAERTEPIYPEGVAQEACQLSHVRPVWRLENNRAVLIAYAIYRGPNNRYGKIPGVLDRGEFGVEIVVQIAYLVYIVGLSFDKVCQLLQFFQNMPLRKSQVDALLYRLSRHWERQFEVLCTLLANSLVVHADETSWSLNSVWAFLSEKARVLLFGVHKDADTLEKILDPATFAGIVISDDAAVYAHFSLAQKCWAHLLRKAIKLTLQDRENADYRIFTDGLLEIYRAACRIQRDRRLGDSGREKKVKALENQLFELCVPMWSMDLPPLEGLANDYRLLVNEVMKLAIDQQLFTFVTAKPVQQVNGTSKPVDGTNNEAERVLRSPAQARDTGRTSKTMKGARRQSILTSVLESLRVYLKTFTLQNVIEEMQRWWAEGRSCFENALKKFKLALPEQSMTDQLFPSPLPNPSG
jgi:transposase